MARVLVGLSGGVDSAVALYLLQKDHQVSACYMGNWDSALNNDFLGNPTSLDEICPQEQDYLDAKSVADQLGVELIRVDFSKQYYDEVFAHFLKEYQLNRTPNPDILCNSKIKFAHFLNYALENGFDYIATGHYAIKVEIDGKYFIKKALDESKDQSYFLSRLTSFQIEKAMFPLGNMSKKEVREIAQTLNLKVAKKKDSTGICFIGERNFALFLQNYLPTKEGDIVDIETNEVLARHIGVFYYTIGQRKGLGIGGIKNKTGRWFVVKKDPKNNILYVDNKEDLLKKRTVTASDIANHLPIPENTQFTLFAKFRYRQKEVEVKATIKNGILYLEGEQIYAPTPGQEVVLYQNDVVILSATIADGEN